MAQVLDDNQDTFEYNSNTPSYYCDQIFNLGNPELFEVCKSLDVADRKTLYLNILNANPPYGPDYPTYWADVSLSIVFTYLSLS